jgi:hypothetical protein
MPEQQVIELTAARRLAQEVLFTRIMVSQVSQCHIQGGFGKIAAVVMGWSGAAPARRSVRAVPEVAWCTAIWSLGYLPSTRVAHSLDGRFPVPINPRHSGRNGRKRDVAQDAY